MGLVVLEIPARPDWLSLARMVVGAAAGLEPTLRDERLDDLRLLVSEATTNAIEAHADLSGTASGRRAERICIRCDLADDRIEVEVVDRGGGFDPDPEAAVEPPSAAGPRERGYGLPLMRVLADETDITSSDTGTTVRLVVYTTRSA